MRFRVGGDNRNGSVSVNSGNKGGPRDDNYNIDPSQKYRKLSRVLVSKGGVGQLNCIGEPRYVVRVRGLREWRVLGAGI